MANVNDEEDSESDCAGLSYEDKMKAIAKDCEKYLFQTVASLEMTREEKETLIPQFLETVEQLEDETKILKAVVKNLYKNLIANTNDPVRRADYEERYEDEKESMRSPDYVVIKNCEFYSTCEHHMFPFFGHISIGYIPNKKVIGVSKLALLADLFAKRMQIQERMTSQIADTLMKELDALGVYVVCEGVHFCMRSRGVKKQDASMITSAVRGIFKKDAKARQEFLTLIKD